MAYSFYEGQVQNITVHQNKYSFKDDDEEQLPLANRNICHLKVKKKTLAALQQISQLTLTIELTRNEEQTSVSKGLLHLLELIWKFM